MAGKLLSIDMTRPARPDFVQGSPAAPLYEVAQRVTPAWMERLALLGVLLVIFAAFLYRLDSVIISDMDEGTYLYAGKLLAQGELPYRDFLLAHPPAIVLLTGGWERLFGSEIMPARIAYLVVILVSTVPLYAITRTLARSALVALVSVATYTAGMILLANMGRTIRLEPVMNAFVIGAFACYVYRPNSQRARGLVGALLAIAILVKLVAIIPAALLLLGDLLWVRPERRFVRMWAVAACGAAVILIPAAALLLSQPGFVDDVLRSQLDRPGLPLQTRLYYLWQDCVRYPLIPAALVAAAWFLRRARDPRARVISLVALGGTLALVSLFRTFFGYYLVQILPWMAVVFALAVGLTVEWLGRRWSRVVLVAGTLLLAGAVPLLYSEVYYRKAHDHVSSPAQIIPELRTGRGYLYTMYPSFALWSGRELYPWYFAADSLVARLTNRIGDEDFVRVFSGCEALVLWPDELVAYPAAQAYVESHFRIAYQDSYYTLWTRSGTES
jgi:hypothetical protein